MFLDWKPKLFRFGSTSRAHGCRVAEEIVLVVCICLPCLNLGAVAQQSNHATGSPSASLAAAAGNTVTLDVVVTDRFGKPVPALPQQDFTLLDNRQPQKIASFTAAESSKTSAEPPVQTLLVLDEVNTSMRHQTLVRQELQKLLGQNTELPQPTSLVFFSDSGAGATKLTRDPKVLSAELQQHPPALPNHKAAQGLWGADERYNLSLRTLGQLAAYESSRPGRKLVIWLGSGWPFLSGPGVDLGVKEQQSLFGTIVELSHALRNARITLYHVDPIGSGGTGREYYKTFTKPVTTTRQVQAGDLSLQVLAYQSGGLVLNSSNDLASEIATCMADANAYYTVTFDAAAGDGPNDFRALEVKLAKPDLTARTRDGYYAQPAPVNPQ